MIVHICDGCGKRIEGAIYKRADGDEDWCVNCVKVDETEVCPHEDNASDQVPGRDTYRLVCKACGYDREVAA